MRAAELVPGDTVATRAGTATVVRVAPHDAPEVVYNLRVERTARYLVGACGAVVHNSPCDRAAKAARGGAVNVTSGSRTVNEALTTGQRFVGEGATEVGSGVFRSADGTRQFRMTDADIAGRHGAIGPHVHFEKFDPVTGDKIKNIHTPLSDK